MYHESQAIIVCFSLITPDSLRSLTDKWLPEILRHNGSAELYFVGTKADLRDSLNRKKFAKSGLVEIVDTEGAKKVAK